MAESTRISTVTTQSRPNFGEEAAALTIRRKMRAVSLLAGLPILCIINNFQNSHSLPSPPQAANDIPTTDASSASATDSSTADDGDPTSRQGERINDEGDDPDQMQCVICLYDVSKGKKYRVLAECRHGFHVDCIDAWLMQNSNCPLCRRSVAYTPAGNGKHQQRRSNEDDDQEAYYEIVIASILSFLDHLRTWLLNPLAFDRSCHDYHAYL